MTNKPGSWLSRPSRASGAPPRTPTGIVGFDELVGGGLPSARTTLVLGGPGCGKTLFALETLVNGAETWNEPGIFVAFEEPVEQVLENVGSLDWNLTALRKRNLFFLDSRLPATAIRGGEFDLLALLSILSAQVRATGAKRVVFDGIDMLMAVLNDRIAERRELLRIGEWLAENRLTGIVTCKVNPGSGHLLDHDIDLPYMADCVVTLRQDPSGSVLMRRLRVSKCRGSSHEGGEVPFTINSSGLQVAHYPSIVAPREAQTERLSTGIERLDTMLGGGYYRGSSAIISGAPGTAKSTLGSAFAASRAAAGERTLYVTFDESASEIVRNAASVGIRLGPHLRSGLLEIVSERRGTRATEDHLAWLADALISKKIMALVIDPVSALAASGGEVVGAEAGARLIAIAKSLGITLVMTTLLAQADAQVEATATGISTLADAWIHLSYVVRSGERNRALTIVKSRGSFHSNQVRELVLGRGGVSLADVFLEGGEVLMGTLRKQKEIDEQARRDREENQILAVENAAKLAVAETRARLTALEHELQLREAALRTARADGQLASSARASRQSQLRHLRRADLERPSARPAAKARRAPKD